MKKLRLSLDALAVESFDVIEGEGSPRGTVPANMATTPDDCWTYPEYCLSNNYTECNTCANTCRNSCNGTCAASCGGTCNTLCGPTYYAATCPPECWD